jgi:RNA polymerase sigma factor (TIGR02999 family)
MKADNLTQILQLDGFATDARQDRWDRILSAVYEDVRVLARRHLRGERRRGTLQTTLLAHDAIERVVLRGSARFSSRHHFYAAISSAIRRSLVDYARSRRAVRRGGGRPVLSLEGAGAALLEPADLRIRQDRTLDVLAVEDALEKLSALAPHQAKLVELRYFAGLNIATVAAVMGTSRSSVERQWRLARAWLLRELSGDKETGKNES